MPPNIIKYLGNLGYGSRREVTSMVTKRQVTRRDGTVVRDGDDFEHDELLVLGESLDPPPGSVIMLHKPAGFVCSTQDEGRRLIYELLPPRLLRRSPAMVSVGRLDRDTSGLLLITDDGALNHRLTSPRSQLTKVYEATLAEDLRGNEGELFGSGTMMLKGEASPLKPARIDVLGARAARVHLTEGRYHQVRRMFAAVGNHVVALHRRSFGGLNLGNAQPGEWRLLNTADRTLLQEAAQSHPPVAAMTDPVEDGPSRS